MEETQAITEGQTLVAQFQVKSNMSLGEARELIRSNTPSAFQVQDINLRETDESLTGAH